MDTPSIGHKCRVAIYDFHGSRSPAGSQYNPEGLRCFFEEKIADTHASHMRPETINPNKTVSASVGVSPPHNQNGPS